MKERPILFSGEMVHAILEGRKTQTRRVIKPQPEMRGNDDCVIQYGKQRHSGPPEYLIKEILPKYGCPYGQPGDRLWVKETMYSDGDHWWFPSTEAGGDFDFPTDSGGEYQADVLAWMNKQDKMHRTSVPSIHMPRWASRITLEVVSVRVERVQDISEADALAEGILDAMSVTSNVTIGQVRVFDFKRLWDSINAERGFGWDANPFVWVIEFKRGEMPR